MQVEDTISLRSLLRIQVFGSFPTDKVPRDLQRRKGSVVRHIQLIGRPSSATSSSSTVSSTASASSGAASSSTSISTASSAISATSAASTTATSTTVSFPVDRVVTRLDTESKVNCLFLTVLSSLAIFLAFSHHKKVFCDCLLFGLNLGEFILDLAFLQRLESLAIRFCLVRHVLFVRYGLDFWFAFFFLFLHIGRLLLNLAWFRFVTFYNGTFSLFGIVLVRAPVALSTTTLLDFLSTPRSTPSIICSLSLT
mmetsp:Transcript_45892/g.68308  ORF Transcript_45892/g.68308 Transcript_45892/m.68308 type:complete len:253 (+) Transcript_45892:1043-1801(+)